MRALIALTAAVLAAATPDPLITPRPQLHPRQDTDPALLGWVSTSGASEFSDQRTCDFPATLSTSGAFAQCCAPSGSACNFFTTCNAGTVVAESTSVFCDQGFCNTGVIVPTTGASDGKSFLGCWATSLGESAFTLVQDIGSAPIATPTGDASSAASSGGSSSRSRASGSGSATGSSGATGASSGTAAANSTGAAAMSAAKPLTGVLGLITWLFAML